MTDFALISQEHNGARDTAWVGIRAKTPPTPGLVPTGEVARKYQISEPAVLKWVDKGMPVAATTPMPNGRNKRWFSVTAVQEWVSANRAHHGHGGVRPGSGRIGRPRKHVATNDQPLITRAEQRQNGIDPDWSAQPATASPSSASQPGTLNYERTRVEQLKAQRMEIELAERRRELLPRSDVEEAVAAAARNLGGLCGTMSGRLAAEIVSRAAIPAGMVPVIEEMIRAECDLLVDAMLADPIGEQQREQQHEQQHEQQPKQQPKNAAAA